MSLSGRPANREDVKHFYPEHSCSFRAWVCEMDGEPVGIVGISLTRPACSIFCTFSEGLRPHLKSLTVLRLLKKLDDFLATLKGPIFAIRDRAERAAVHILKRLGFRFHMMIDGDAVYIRGSV